jgi:hypothetical protein
VKNIISIIGIAGITIAVLAFILSIIFSVFYLNENYPLKFEDNQGYFVDGTVYINDNYVGETRKGKLFLKEFTPGELSIFITKDGTEYVNYYDINRDHLNLELKFIVSLLKEDELNPEEDNNTNYSSYLDPIVINDPKLRLEATNAIKSCSSNDKECQIISIYEYFLTEYKYFSDPRNDEYIQTPFETIKYKGGDCEDLSILLNSFLENIGVETWLAITEDHVYSLACGVDPDILKNYTLELFYDYEFIENLNQTINLSPYEVWNYGFEDNDLVDYLLFINGNLNSKNKFTIFAYNTQADFDSFMNDLDYKVIENTYFENITSKYIDYSIPFTGGFLIFNTNNRNINVNLDLNVNAGGYLLDYDELDITKYKLNNQICVPLDPSVGESSYVGYEASPDVSKIFINTLTREEYKP